VERYSTTASAEPLIFRPIRRAVAAYEKWLHPSSSYQEVTLALHRLLEQPPTDFDNHIYADRALQQFNEEDPTNVVRTNVDRIARLMLEVDQRKARLLLFEVPYSMEIGNSRFARISSEIVHEKFRDPDRWLRIEFPRGELRWADGVHLDE